MPDLPPAPRPVPPAADPLAATRRWLERAVIGLNLCPFAKAVHVRGQIRWVLSEADTPESLLLQLAEELRFLAAADPDAVDTTLLVHPRVLHDFLDFNDFVGVAEDLLVELGLEGTLQIASFHPDFRFADGPEDHIGHHTNRSPHPTLHLLREDSIERAVAGDEDEAARIVERNLDTLDRLGLEGWRRLMADD